MTLRLTLDRTHGGVVSRRAGEDRWLAVLALAGITACVTHTSETEVEDEILARVDGIPISVAEFESHLRRSRIDAEDTLISSSANDAQKRALITNLIERRLVLREAEAQNVIVGSDEVERQFDRMRDPWPEHEFEADLKRRDLTPVELRREIRELLTVRRFFRDHVFSRVAVTAEEIDAYLEKHPDSAVIPERVRARHIVVATAAKAEEVLREIREGLPFEEAAMKYSKSPEGRSGGELGFFKLGEMPKVFDEVCFQAPVGVVDRVVASDYGFHLFKVVAKRPPARRSRKRTRERIEEQLLEHKQREFHAVYVRNLFKKTKIEIREKRLASIY